MDKEVLLISYESNLSENLNSQFFKKTLEKNNWKFKFIGDKEKWIGFKSRINGYYNFLKSLPDDKVVVLSDARDVFCLRDPSLFVEKIKNKIDKKIIISAECFLKGHMEWNKQQIKEALKQDSDFFFQGVPLDKYWEYYDKTNDLPYRKYLNAGLIIGKVINLVKAFKWIIDNNYNDDQLGFSEYTNNYPDLVYLDHDAKFVHTSTSFIMGGLYNLSIQKKDTPSFDELFGLSSYFLHIPGLNISKGQKKIYNTIYKILDKDIIDCDMFSIYNKEPYHF